MSHIKKCCPAEDLMGYVLRNHFDEIRSSLRLKEEFTSYAKSTKARIAINMRLPIEEITFVGVHNRRTVRRKRPFSDEEIVHFSHPIRLGLSSLRKISTRLEAIEKELLS